MKPLMTHIRVILTVCSFWILGLGNGLSAGDAEFEKLYNYYFPKHGAYINTIYRQSFDKALFGSSPTASWKKRDRELYYAFRGDPAAFRAFVRSHEGEDTDWDYQTVLLLLKLGDNRFSQLLAREDRPTRESVGVAIDTQIDWTKHHFPKTRALYSYRYKPQRGAGRN